QLPHIHSMIPLSRLFLFFYCYAHHLDLHSFPTRRSSDLARWLLNPDKIEEMVSAVVEAVKKPVTVKMRIGWDSKHIYAVENAKRSEEHTSELQSRENLVCRLLLEKKKKERT